MVSLTGFWESLTLGNILLGVVMFVASLAFSFGSLALVMVKFPLIISAPIMNVIFCRTARG